MSELKNLCRQALMVDHPGHALKSLCEWMITPTGSGRAVNMPNVQSNRRNMQVDHADEELNKLLENLLSGNSTGNQIGRPGSAPSLELERPKAPVLGRSKSGDYKRKDPPNLYSNIEKIRIKRALRPISVRNRKGTNLELRNKGIGNTKNVPTVADLRRRMELMNLKETIYRKQTNE